MIHFTVKTADIDILNHFWSKIMYILFRCPLEQFRGWVVSRVAVCRCGEEPGSQGTGNASTTHIPCRHDTQLVYLLMLLFFFVSWENRQVIWSIVELSKKKDFIILLVVTLLPSVVKVWHVVIAELSGGGSESMADWLGTQLTPLDTTSFCYTNKFMMQIRDNCASLLPNQQVIKSSIHVA